MQFALRVWSTKQSWSGYPTTRKHWKRSPYSGACTWTSSLRTEKCTGPIGPSAVLGRIPPDRRLWRSSWIEWIMQNGPFHGRRLWQRNHSITWSVPTWTAQRFFVTDTWLLWPLRNTKLSKAEIIHASCCVTLLTNSRRWAWICVSTKSTFNVTTAAKREKTTLWYDSLDIFVRRGLSEQHGCIAVFLDTATRTWTSFLASSVHS